MKCRAIIPANRAGAEPFFHRPPFPPANAFVDSGFSNQWREYREAECPFITYIAKAKYIPFAGVTVITLEFESCTHSDYCSMRKLCGISTYKEKGCQSSSSNIVTQTVKLPHPPRTLKVSLQVNPSGHYYSQTRHIFIQVLFFSLDSRGNY